MKRTQKGYTKRTHTGRHTAGKKRSAFRRFLTGVLAVLLVMTCSFGFGSFFSSAHGSPEEEPVDYKYYKSIQISDGDSLWSIAERYMGSEYDSVADYIDELVEMNHISAAELDSLQEGDYLVVAYTTHSSHGITAYSGE